MGKYVQVIDLVFNIIIPSTSRSLTRIFLSNFPIKCCVHTTYSAKQANNEHRFSCLTAIDQLSIQETVNLSLPKINLQRAQRNKNEVHMEIVQHKDVNTNRDPSRGKILVFTLVG